MPVGREYNVQITIYCLCKQNGQIQKNRRTIVNKKSRKNERKRKKKIGRVPDRKKMNWNSKVTSQTQKLWPL